MADPTNVMPYRRTTVINQFMLLDTEFSLNLQHHVGFAPKYMIVGQLTYTNIVTGNDMGTFLIWCSLRSDYIGAVSAGPLSSTSITPGSIFPMDPSQQSLHFRITNAHSVGPAATGILTMVLEFVKD